MSSGNRESGDEIIEMKSLFKMLVESQNKQAESLAKLADTQAESLVKLGETQAHTQQQIVASLAKQAESLARLGDTQANTQQQIIEILSRSTNSAGNNQKQQGDNASSSGVRKQEIAEAPDNNDEEEPELDPGYEAQYVPDVHNRLLGAMLDTEVETAIEYLKNNPTAIEKALLSNKHTAVHLAVVEHRRGDGWIRKPSYAERMRMLEEILKLSATTVLEHKESTTGFTALHLAASEGNVKAVVMLVGKYPRLSQIRDYNRMTPLETALLFVTAGQKKILQYLYSVTKDEEPSPFSGTDGARLLCNAIDAGFYDLACCLVYRFPKLVTVKSVSHNMCGLEVLARKPCITLTWWQSCVSRLIEGYIHRELDFKDTEEEEGHKSIFTSYLRRVFGFTNVYNLEVKSWYTYGVLDKMTWGLKGSNTTDEIKKFFHSNPDIMKVAIKHGNTLFVYYCLRYFDYLVWENFSGQRMLTMAIIERNEEIVHHICSICANSGKDMTALVSLVDNDERNTILHCAAKLASPAHLSSIPGVALQIQRELQWLKGVESIMPENDRFKKNEEGYTAQQLFTKEHKELLKDGEDWMKDTSGSSMIVAALIATVAFAAAFTVPGGNISDSENSKNGTPVFLGKASFTVFAVADAVALFSSIISVLMFLAIYTSRYSEMDFLKSLPQKLIMGLATLFISMAAILVGFCASLLIMVGEKFPRAIIPIASFGCVPVVLFAWLQLPLLYKMVRLTYWGSLLKKHRYIDPRDEAYNRVRWSRY